MKIGNIEVYGVIYRIENNINKKSYIGKTTKGFRKRYSYKGNSLIEKVYNYHNSAKLKNKAYNKHICRAIEKYGFDNFNVYEVIDISFSQEELDIKEKSWIQIYDSLNNGYNKTIGGDGSSGINRPKGNKSYRHTKIICLNDLRIFDCIIDASIYYEANKTSISANCSNNIKKNYVEGKNNTELKFMYYDDYILASEEEIKQKLEYKFIHKNGGNVYNAKKIICLTTNEIFYSLSEAARKYNIIGTANISKCCKNKKGYSGVLNNSKLTWMYYEDYINGEQYNIKTKN
jgi:hypothetical protein